MLGITFHLPTGVVFCSPRSLTYLEESLSKSSTQTQHLYYVFSIVIKSLASNNIN